MDEPEGIKTERERLEELRRQIHFHNYRYHVSGRIR